MPNQFRVGETGVLHGSDQTGPVFGCDAKNRKGAESGLGPHPWSGDLDWARTRRAY